jgi:outer membrane murein-binding lipoprotein Lpp
MNPLTLPTKILAGAAALLLLAGGVFWGIDRYQKGKGTKNEQQSQQLQGEANAHASNASSIPDHAQQLQSAKDDVARARAEVERVKRLLAAKPIISVPDHSGSGSPLPSAVDPDPRDQVIASQGVLIEKLDAQVGGLQLALSDEQKRSAEFKLAFETERKATAAQAVATEAWKKAVTSIRWRGRVEGFAAGVALGYVGGKR